MLPPTQARAWTRGGRFGLPGSVQPGLPRCGRQEAERSRAPSSISGRETAERGRVSRGDRLPLALLVIAAVPRLVAAVFARGYGMHDDHFFVIEVAQRWREGHRDWLGDPSSYHGLLYPGLHWALFGGLERIGVTDPQTKMLVVRLLHAGWSLLTVVYGYRTALALSDARKARICGLLLALLWFLPWTSVRNLPETFCHPLLAVAAYRLAGAPSPKRRDLVVAGGLMGLAFVVRFQTAVATAAIAVVLLAQRRPRAVLAFGGAAVLFAVATLGVIDGIGYGRPFSSLLAYVAYNASASNVARFPKGPWYQYAGLLAGALVPPLSVLLLWGFIRSWRRAPLLFWPAVAFLAVHSAYPNKQERFILPVLPFLLVLAMVGWEDFADCSRFWRARPRLAQAVWLAFLAVDLPLLVVQSTTYSKKTRIEPLSLLYGRDDVQGVVIETSEESPPAPPLFYLGKNVPVFLVGAAKPVSQLDAEIAASGRPRPNYVVMLGDSNLEARRARLSTVFRSLAVERRIEPDLVDSLAHRFNPRYNVNLTAYLCRSAER